MPLEKVPGEPGAPESGAVKVLAVPAEAVLTTGRRSLVYVEVAPGEFRLVEPKLGPRTGDYYPVVAGLEKGQHVVTRGNFLLDSQFQITGKPSLFYPEGISGGGSGHSGHSMPSGPPATGGSSPDRVPSPGAEPAGKPGTPGGHEGHQGRH
jgi:hypothetical protein